MTSTPASPAPVIARASWQADRTAHEIRARALLAPLQSFRQRGLAHPVYDFLVHYYSFRPGHLLRWSPGAGPWLEGEPPVRFPWLKWVTQRSDAWCLDPSHFPTKRKEALRWTLGLLTAIETRPPFFGCYGLHEWAMVYEAADIRHPAHPLRLPHKQIRDVVERHPVCCSHYDAFRFFSATARPLNRLQPSRETRPALEQPGCIHVTMDLYKWSYKWSPWIPSGLLADTFELAWQAREIDMRASPYDLRPLGFEPIPIETPEGRAAYEAGQRSLAARAVPLRTRLIHALREMIRSDPP